MIYSKSIQVDIAHQHLNDIIRLHEGDALGAQLQISMYNNSDEFNLEGLTIKYDAVIAGYLAEQDATATILSGTDNVIVVPITANMCAKSGTLEIDVKLIEVEGSTESVLFLQRLEAIVQRRVINEDVIIDVSGTTIYQKIAGFENNLQDISNDVKEITDTLQNLINSKANIKTTTTNSGLATAEIPFIDNATENDVLYRVIGSNVRHVEGYVLFLGNIKRASTTSAVAQIRFSRTGSILSYRSGMTNPGDVETPVSWDAAWSFVEQTGNKVRAISDDSPSDDKYPSEKAVRDYVAEKVSDPEYIAYDQRNKNVVEFLDVYDDYADCSSDPDTSYLTSLLDNTTRYSDLTTDNEEYSRPLGVNVDLPSAGTLMIRDGKKTMSYAVPAGLQKVYNITPGNVGAYYLRDSSGNLIDYKLLKPLRTDPHPLRMVYCKVTRNIRDLGGWACDGGTIKFGKLFRGAIPFKNPANISEDIDANDVDYDKKVLHDLLGIRFELDLQTGRADQAAVVPGGSVIGDDVDYIAILGTYYALQDFLAANGKYTYSKTDTPLDIAPQYLRMFRCIVDCAVNNIPLYFHCLEGADRTGTLAMMIEAVLGVSPSDIDKDYELTTFQTGNKDNHTNWRRRNERSSSGNRGWRVLMFGNESLSPALPGIYNYPGVTGDNLRDRVVSWLLMMSEQYPTYAISLSDINAFRAAMIDGLPDVIVG